MARGKGLSPEDVRLWAAYGLTLTKLMPGRTRLPPPPEPAVLAPEPAPKPVPAQKPRLAQAPGYLGVNATPAGLDKSTWAKFRAGKMRVEAKLDLHGHTATRAHRGGAELC